MLSWIKRAAGAGADFALVKGKHQEAFNRLVQECVVLGHHVFEKQVGRLAAQLQRDGNQVLAGVLHDEAARSGLPGERYLGDSRTGCQRLAGLLPKSIHNIQNAGGKKVGDQFGQHKNTCGRLLRRFQHYAVTRGQGRRQFPRRHQDGKIPRDDLADHSQRFVEMVGHRLGVDLRNGAFLGPHAAGEIAEMIDGEWYIRVFGLANRLAVVPGFGGGKAIQIVLHALRNAIEDVRPLGRGDSGPFIFCGVGGVQGSFHVRAIGARNPAQQLAIDGRSIVKITAVDGRKPGSSNEISIDVTKWRHNTGTDFYEECGH